MYILSGSLADLPLSNLLQTIGAGHKTGRLVLTRRDGHAVVVFRDGKIILAATTGARESFGSILLTKRLVSESTLIEALGRQARSATETRLGAVLVAMGALGEADVEAVLHAQVQKVLSELLGWTSGFVKFEALDIPDCGEVSVVADDFVLHEGLSPDAAVVGAMQESGPRRTDSGELRLLSALGAPPADAPPSAEPPRTASLRTIMAEIRSPAFPGEISLAILRRAAWRLERGVLLQRTSDGLRGMGQFGVSLPGKDPNERVREIRIPADEGSVFLEVLERRETYRGPLEPLFWNVEFIRRIGGGFPAEAVLIPMLVEDRVVLILYGDNSVSSRPIGELDDLEALMIEGGLIIEKSLLDARLTDLEARRSGKSPTGTSE